MSEPVTVVRSGDLKDGPTTAGMTRYEAFASGTAWAGRARTDPRMVSGWHHHGEHESVLYIVSGALRMEFGPGGSQVLDASPGDFVRVPKGTVHRESNPSDDPADIIVVRFGEGESLVNTDGPE
jgi:uncharacterized RmlC-like cupin family protein